MISLFLLVAFVKISIHYNNPLVLAGLYTILATLFSAAFGVELATLAVAAMVTFGLTWLFFWLLDRYEDSGVWWGIMIVFPVLMLVVSSAQ